MLLQLVINSQDHRYNDILLPTKSVDHTFMVVLNQNCMDGISHQSKTLPISVFKQDWDLKSSYFYRYSDNHFYRRFNSFPLSSIRMKLIMSIVLFP